MLGGILGKCFLRSVGMLSSAEVANLLRDVGHALPGNFEIEMLGIAIFSHFPVSIWT